MRAITYTAWEYLLNKMEPESAEAFQKVTFGSLVDDPTVHRVVDANVRQRIIRGDFSLHSWPAKHLGSCRMNEPVSLSVRTGKH